MNYSYETPHERVTAPLLLLASITSRMSNNEIAMTPDPLGKLGIASGSAASDIYGHQDMTDLLMISPSNQTTQSVHIATLAVCNVLIAIVVLMGCVGNGAVIVQVITHWNSRFGYAPLLLNLAVSDFLICSCLSPVFLIFLYRSPPTPNIFCGLFTFMGTICTLSSLLTMTAIALHRYRLMSVSTGQRYLGIPIALLTLTFIWALGFSVATAGILYVSSNWNDPFQNCELVNVVDGQRGSLTDFAISFLAPACAIGFLCTVASCLVMVWVATLPTCWRNTCDFYQTEVARTNRKPKMPQVVSIGFKQLIGCFSMVDKETRILYLLAILVASLCWTPILIAQILTMCLGESLLLYQLKLCGIALVFLNSALHPYIYTEHGWRLKNRYRVCLHAAFDCHRVLPTDQWSLGGGVAGNSANAAGTSADHPLVVSVGTGTDEADIGTIATMSVTGSVIETRICDCNKNVICDRNQLYLNDNSAVNRNVTDHSNVSNNNNNVHILFGGEVEDNDTLDSGIDRDALSDVDYMEVSANNQCQHERPAAAKDKDGLEDYQGSLDSFILTTKVSSNSSLYSVDAAENLTVNLPPRNMTPTNDSHSNLSDGSATIARRSRPTSWSTAPQPRNPTTTATASSRQRHRYHYHHLHHHHHVIVFPNNSDYAAATDSGIVQPQSYPCDQVKEPAKDEGCAAGVNSSPHLQQQQILRYKDVDETGRQVREENKDNNTFCVDKNCVRDFHHKVRTASVSGNKTTEALLRLLRNGEGPSSSLSTSTPSSSSSSSSFQRRIPPHSLPPCTCPLPLDSPHSRIVTDSSEENCPVTVRSPLITHCPLHCDRPYDHCRHPVPNVTVAEYWYPSHGDGLFVTEHSCADPQHPVAHPHYRPEYFKFYPTHLKKSQTRSHNHHKRTHEQTQTDPPPRQKTHKNKKKGKIEEK